MSSRDFLHITNKAFMKLWRAFISSNFLGIIRRHSRIPPIMNKAWWLFTIFSSYNAKKKLNIVGNTTSAGGREENREKIQTTIKFALEFFRPLFHHGKGIFIHTFHTNISPILRFSFPSFIRYVELSNHAILLIIIRPLAMEMEHKIKSWKKL